MHIERVIEIIAHIYSHRDYRIPVELYKSQNTKRESHRDQSIHVQRAIEIKAHMSIVRTFILQFYLNTRFMNRVGECYFSSIVRRQYFSIILNEKSADYT